MVTYTFVSNEPWKRFELESEGLDEIRVSSMLILLVISRLSQNQTRPGNAEMALNL